MNRICVVVCSCLWLFVGDAELSESHLQKAAAHHPIYLFLHDPTFSHLPDGAQSVPSITPQQLVVTAQQPKAPRTRVAADYRAMAQFSINQYHDPTSCVFSVLATTRL
jgi:hypothetical protein